MAIGVTEGKSLRLQDRAWLHHWYNAFSKIRRWCHCSLALDGMFLLHQKEPQFFRLLLKVFFRHQIPDCQGWRNNLQKARGFFECVIGTPRLVALASTFLLYKSRPVSTKAGLLDRERESAKNIGSPKPEAVGKTYTGANQRTMHLKILIAFVAFFWQIKRWLGAFLPSSRSSLQTHSQSHWIIPRSHTKSRWSEQIHFSQKIGDKNHPKSNRDPSNSMVRWKNGRPWVSPLRRWVFLYFFGGSRNTGEFEPSWSRSWRILVASSCYWSI